jgi:hypothetical protein
MKFLPEQVYYVDSFDQYGRYNILTSIFTFVVVLKYIIVRWLAKLNGKNPDPRNNFKPLFPLEMKKLLYSYMYRHKTGICHFLIQQEQWEKDTVKIVKQVWLGSEH